MKAYLQMLNEISEGGSKIDLEQVMRWWIEKVKLHFARKGPKFQFDNGKSVSWNLANIFAQALEIQKNSGGANFVGAMLQHLVGAKLDIVLGAGVASHHGYSVADHSTDRLADFEVNGVAIHVTTHPSEALIRKAAQNIQSGIKPIIVTLADGVVGATYLLKDSEWKERIDVIDATQFLIANVYERSLFNAGECKATLAAILTRYSRAMLKRAFQKGNAMQAEGRFFCINFPRQLWRFGLFFGAPISMQSGARASCSHQSASCRRIVGTHPAGCRKERVGSPRSLLISGETEAHLSSHVFRVTSCRQPLPSGKQQSSSVTSPR